jgi:hypothetical protein
MINKKSTPKIKKTKLKAENEYEYVKKSENNLEKIKQRIKKKTEEGVKKVENDVFSKLNGFLQEKNTIVSNQEYSGKDKSEKEHQEKNSEKSESENLEIKEENLENEDCEENVILNKSLNLKDISKSENNQNEEMEIKLIKRNQETQTEEIVLKKVKMDINAFEKRSMVQNLLKLEKIVKEIKDNLSKEKLDELDKIKEKQKESVG